MPASITTVDRYAFYNCQSLTSVTIASGVTAIGDYTFKRCSELSSITIPAGVTTIGIEAFANCTSLGSMTFLGLTAPTSVSTDWILGTTSVTGHASSGSNFPSPGTTFNGLMMGSAISSNSSVPGAPTALAAVNGPGFVQLIWLAPTDAGNPALSRYDVYRSDPLSTSSGLSLIGNVPVGTLSYNDTTATATISYLYTVKAVNSIGSGNASNEVTGMAGATAPSPPQDLKVSFGNNNATLTWTAPANNGGSAILSYDIYRADSGGNYDKIDTVPAGTLTYLDANGTSSDSYYVVAVNSAGAGTQSTSQGKPSDESIVQKALPPVAAVAVGSTLAFIGFAVVSGASETATTIANGFDSVKEYLRRLFRLDKVFDFFMDLFKERGQESIWKQVEKVELEDKEAVERPALFAGFSALEMIVIFFTAVFLGLAFMITNKIDLGSLSDWLIYIVVAGLAVSLHDLTHRYVAWRYSVPTEYKFWFLGTAIMFITALAFGAVFSTPSRLAIEEEDKMTVRQKAMVYGSGPIMSVIMFVVFLAMLPLGGTAATIGGVGASMNLLTATYAMMPFDPMDGRKVYKWKKLAWAAMFVPMIVMYFVLIIFII